MQNVAPIVKRIAAVAAALACILYAGDFISVKFSRDPLSVVQINKIYTVPQKGGKTEYEPGEPDTETCVNALFPHLGYNPCWYVDRHRNQQIDYRPRGRVWLRPFFSSRTVRAVRVIQVIEPLSNHFLRLGLLHVAKKLVAVECD
jgi:hypothetical protein